jgi:hypothetical protein
MARRDGGTARRWRQRQTRRQESVGQRAVGGGRGGPWQWQWRRRRRRHRAVGCVLWLLTLLVVLLVLSILFGGFHRGARDGGGQAHLVQPAMAQHGTPARTAWMPGTVRSGRLTLR